MKAEKPQEYEKGKISKKTKYIPYITPSFVHKGIGKHILCMHTGGRILILSNLIMQT